MKWYFIVWTFLATNIIWAQDICEGCGFYAIHLESGEIRNAGNYDHAFIPASTWKVITALSSLDRFGEASFFESHLFVQGQLDRFGVLWGDIVLRPDRDPTWRSRHSSTDENPILEELAQAIKDEGIECVAGSVVVDLSASGTDVLAPTWPWEDLGNYYASGAWGLNYGDNIVKLTFERGKGGPILKSVQPESKGVSWINELRYGEVGSGDQAYIHAAPFQNVRYIRGTLPRDMKVMTIKGAMRDPVEIFLKDWGSILNNQGIEFEELTQVHDVLPMEERSKPIYSIKTPLRSVVKVALEESDNLYTEALFRKAFPGKTYKASLYSYTQYLRKKGWNVVPKDGAGLSPALRWSPAQAGQMLNAMLEVHPTYQDYLPNILETSLGRFVGKDSRSKAKSGSMTDVTTYLGVWESEWVFFVGHNGPLTSRADVRKEMVEWLLQLPLSRK